MNRKMCKQLLKHAYIKAVHLYKVLPHELIFMYMLNFEVLST